MAKAFNIPPQIEEKILALRTEGKSYKKIGDEVGYNYNIIRDIVLRNTSLRQVDYYITDSSNPKCKGTTFYIDADIRQQFQSLAKREGISMRTVLSKLMKTWVDENK
jgi:hypothetical protein